MNKRNTGFTLVEILVVVGIIALLAALLFPAFSRARETARQTKCVSNLQQIGMAVQQYRKEEGRYPDSLMDLLGQGMKVRSGTTSVELLGNAPGYLKVSLDDLVCQNDDTDPSAPRSSYGSLDVSKATPTTALPNPLTAANASSFTGDIADHLWNYWGLRPDGFSFQTAEEASQGTWPPSVSAAPANAVLLVDQTSPYNYPGIAGYNASKPINVVKNSLSNRFGTNAIVTHCVYHRLPTANNLNSPQELYVVPDDSKNARDMVVRADGSAKNIDVSTWNTTGNWQKQLN